MEEITEEQKKKTDSKKFIVWLIWLLLALCNLALDIVIIIVTKTTLDSSMIELTEKILGWFFAISMMYLGMNVTQKVAYMAKDVLTNEESK